ATPGPRRTNRSFGSEPVGRPPMPRRYARSAMTTQSSAPGPLRAVAPLAAELGERCRTAGYQLFLVGGAVRELLMGHPSRGEFDFATDARPEETVRILQGWAEWRRLVGIR